MLWSKIMVEQIVFLITITSSNKDALRKMSSKVDMLVLLRLHFWYANVPTGKLKTKIEAI